MSRKTVWLFFSFIIFCMWDTLSKELPSVLLTLSPRSKIFRFVACTTVIFVYPPRVVNTPPPLEDDTPLIFSVF